jgi:cell division septum initiation protein DivIVA
MELVAERMEELVRENIQLKERSESLQQQVSSQTGREQAVQDALVTAQELRSDIKIQAQREAEHALTEAQTEARRLLNEAEAEVRTLIRGAERKLEMGKDALEEMERRRVRFLKTFRQLLEREMDVVQVEEERPPLEDRAIDLDLGGGRSGLAPDEAVAHEPATEEADFFDAPRTEEAGGQVTVDLSAVDESAAEQPPMDLPVDELAAAYGSEDESGAGAPSSLGAEGDEDTLFLSLGGQEPESVDGPDDDKGWG